MITIELTNEELSYIGELLAKEPYGKVVTLVNKLQRSINIEAARIASIQSAKIFMETKEIKPVSVT